MNETKSIRLSSDLHKMLKLASVEAGLSMQEFLKRVITKHASKQGHDESLPDCPLCRKYGLTPNAETREAIEESYDPKKLHGPFANTDEMLKDLDSDD